MADDAALQTTSSDSTHQQRLRKRVQGILTDDEEILAVAAQTGLARYWIFKSDGIVVTNQRMLLLTRGLFSFNFEDFHWEHIQDVHFEDHFTGATVKVRAHSSDSGYTSKAASRPSTETDRTGLVTDQAQRVYSVAQKLEQDWRARRRRRMMQEKQAEKGHVVVDSADDTDEPDLEEPPADTPSFERRVQKLKQMRDNDLISDTEFEQKKQELLDSI
jgi:hypothetical protein